jgi:hypothetical protein
VTRVSHNFILSLIIAILLASPIAIRLVAQTGSVRLEGTVRDPSGNPLPGSTLTAIEESSGYQSEAVSDASGCYGFPALPPGIYTVTAKAKDFKDVIHRRIFLFSPGDTVENFNFEVSEIDREIGPDQRLRIHDSDTSDSYPRQTLEALPLLNHDPLELLVYQPGVQIKGGSEGESTVNGTRQTMNAIVLDGLSVEDPVDPRFGSSLVKTNPDSLSGIQIVTAGGNAEYGRSGGAQVVMLSRPGTKSWAGNIYDYFRNSGFDANDFFSNKYGVPRMPYNRNIFGATASGPIGNKTFIFANFEGNRTDQRVTRNRLVLTETAKTGEFQWYTPDDTVRDETTIRSFDIVANDPRGLGIDPSVAAIIAKLPDPNNFSIGDGLNTGGYSFNNPIHLDQQQVAARVDHSLNSKHRLFFRFNMEHTNATDVLNSADAPFPGEPAGTHVENNWGFAAASDYSLNPNMVNELRVGYLRPKTDLKRSARSTDPMFLANSWTNPLDPSFPQSFHNSIFEIADSFSYLKGLHTFKFGATFRRTLQSSVDYSGAYPNVTFGTGQGNAPGSAIGPSEQSEISSTDRITFENLYNDLLGRMESVSQTFYSSLTSTLPAGTGRNRNYAFQEYGLFVQDNFRIRPNLTLNLGLRYELNTVPKEANGFQGVLDQASQITGTANISDFGIAPGNNWYDMDVNNFAPRAGFAWDIFGSGALVLRGAYGIYYDRLIGGITNFVDRNSYGFSQSVSIYPNASGTDLRLGDGIPLPTQPGAPNLQPPLTRSTTIAVLDPNLRTPRVDQISLKLEKRIFGAIMEAGYVGTRSKNLFQYLNLNQTKTNGDFLEAFRQLQEYRAMGTPVPPTNTLIRIFGSPLAAFNALGGMNFDTGQLGVAADILDRNYYSDYSAAGVSDYYLRNFPQFDQFLFGTNGAESWYDSLQAGIRKSTNHYDLRIYYTWSKSLDTMSASGTGFVSPADSFNPKFDKAPSDFGRTHVLNIAWNYALPFLRERDNDLDLPKWVEAAFGGWNLGTLCIWESGAHFSVYSGRQNLYAGVDSLANFEGSRDIGRSFTLYNNINWFTPDEVALFSYPEAGELSSSGRNSFTGPRYFNLDLLLHKNFWIGEKQSVQLRLEAFNPFNSTRFNLPNMNLSDPRFGIITSTVGNSRVLQFALKYQF